MPSGGKPTNIDAQRILAIMDELKEKLTYLSVVTAQVLEGLQSEDGQAAQEQLGPELMKAFQEQIRLEELYVVDHTSADGGFSAPRADEGDESLEEINKLTKNTLDLCRKMKVLPNVVSHMRDFQETRPQVVIQFLKTLQDLQDLTLKRLTTTKEEDASRQELLDQYKARQEEATFRKRQLDTDLANLRRECEKAQSQRTEILTKLKADLLDVKESKKEKMEQLQRHYDTRRQDFEEKFKAKEADYLAKIAALMQANKKQREDSHQDESNQKKQVRNKQREVQMVIEAYDQDVKDKVANLDEYHKQVKKDQKHLTELREHFKKVESERSCIDSEEKITEARGIKVQREMGKRNTDSAYIQAFWRGVLQRDAYDVEKKKANKKKKGGKKKK